MNEKGIQWNQIFNSINEKEEEAPWELMARLSCMHL